MKKKIPLTSPSQYEIPKKPNFHRIDSLPLGSAITSEPRRAFQLAPGEVPWVPKLPLGGTRGHKLQGLLPCRSPLLHPPAISLPSHFPKGKAIALEKLKWSQEMAWFFAMKALFDGKLA